MRTHANRGRFFEEYLQHLHACYRRRAHMTKENGMNRTVPLQSRSYASRKLYGLLLVGLVGYAPYAQAQQTNVNVIIEQGVVVGNFPTLSSCYRYEDDGLAVNTGIRPELHYVVRQSAQK